MIQNLTIPRSNHADKNADSGQIAEMAL